MPRDAADLLRLSARSVLDAPDVDRFLESVGAGCPVCLPQGYWHWRRER